MELLDFAGVVFVEQDSMYTKQGVSMTQIKISIDGEYCGSCQHWRLMSFDGNVADKCDHYDADLVFDETEKNWKRCPQCLASEVDES